MIIHATFCVPWVQLQVKDIKHNRLCNKNVVCFFMKKFVLPFESCFLIINVLKLKKYAKDSAGTVLIDKVINRDCQNSLNRV